MDEKKNIFNVMKGDRIIWIIFSILLLISLIFVYDSTGMLVFNKHHNNKFYFLVSQFIFIVLAFATAFFMSHVSYKKLFKIADVLYIIGVALLIYTLIFGEDTNGAKRWIKIPIINLTLQSSDVAKVFLTIFIAKTMGIHQRDKEDIKRGVIISAGATLLVCLLILPSNLSTAILIAFTSALLLIIARASIKHIALGSVVLVIIALLGVFTLGKTGVLKRAETWTHRIESYVTPKTEDSKDNFQATQAKIAVARGGLFMQAGIQKNILPHPYSDFIFAIILEEGGIIVALAIIFLYFLLMHRSVLTAKYQEKPFAAFLCIGLALNIVFQALANMVVSVGLFPVTGQPLPFISLGGTSLIISSFSIGIIINISRYSNKEGKEKEKEEVEAEDREQNLEDITDFPFIMG